MIRIRSRRLALWCGAVVIALVLMQQLLSHYSLAELKLLVMQHKISLLAVYAVLLSLRGVLFIPTMPFIILMASTLPPTVVFIVTLSASCVSALLVCVAVDELNMAARLHRISGRTARRATTAVQKNGFYAVIGWAFFPFVFTEIIVYLARATQLSRKAILLAVAIGEGGLVLMVIRATQFFQSLLLQQSL